MVGRGRQAACLRLGIRGGASLHLGAQAVSGHRSLPTERIAQGALPQQSPRAEKSAARPIWPVRERSGLTPALHGEGGLAVQCCGHWDRVPSAMESFCPPGLLLFLGPAPVAAMGVGQPRWTWQALSYLPSPTSWRTPSLLLAWWTWSYSLLYRSRSSSPG